VWCAQFPHSGSTSPYGLYDAALAVTKMIRRSTMPDCPCDDGRYRPHTSPVALDITLAHDVEALEKSACLIAIAWLRRGERQHEC
jgi:hypothetical protein